MGHKPENLKPGRELDALVAEKLMGISDIQWTEEFTREGGKVPCKGHPWMGRSGFYENAIYRYSTDIFAAWEVVGKLISRERPYFQCGITDVYTHPKPTWYAEFDLDRSMKRVFAKGETAPHAICLAALKAVGVEVG